MNKILSKKAREKTAEEFKLTSKDEAFLKRMLKELECDQFGEPWWRNACANIAELHDQYLLTQRFWLSEPARNRVVSIYIDRTYSRGMRLQQQEVVKKELSELHAAITYNLDYWSGFGFEKLPLEFRRGGSKNGK